MERNKAITSVHYNNTPKYQKDNKNVKETEKYTPRAKFGNVE